MGLGESVVIGATAIPFLLLPELFDFPRHLHAQFFPHLFNFPQIPKVVAQSDRLHNIQKRGVNPVVVDDSFLEILEYAQFFAQLWFLFLGFAENLVDSLLHQLFQGPSVGEMNVIAIGAMEEGRDVGDEEGVVVLGLVVVFESVVDVPVGLAKVAEEEEREYDHDEVEQIGDRKEEVPVNDLLCGGVGHKIRTAAVLGVLLAVVGVDYAHCYCKYGNGDEESYQVYYCEFNEGEEESGRAVEVERLQEQEILEGGGGVHIHGQLLG